MKTKIQKWGNSFAVRLPKDVVVAKNLTAGTAVTIGVKDEQIVIDVADGADSLSKLLESVTEDNLHAETNWDDPAGKEVW